MKQTDFNKYYMQTFYKLFSRQFINYSCVIRIASFTNNNNVDDNCIF